MKPNPFLAILMILAGFSAPTATADDTTPIDLVALGTSLTAGFGLPPEDGFTEQLSRALASQVIAHASSAATTPPMTAPIPTSTPPRANASPARAIPPLAGGPGAERLHGKAEGAR